MQDSERLARRDARRRESARRRRRTRLTLCLTAATIVVLAVVVLASGGSDSSKGGSSASSGPGNRRSSPARAESSSGGTRAHGELSLGEPRSTAAALGPATGTPGTETAPILMYHVINPPPPGAPFPGLYVAAEEFEAQMKALASAGYHAVTLDQLRAYWQHGARLPAGKPIVVSFDNGYQSQYSNALPVLRRLGWVGDENLQLTGLPPSQGGLSQAQIQGLVSAGWELDTQGFSHADLITLDQSQLEYQVAGARKVIQARYHVPVNWFCYPSGHYDPAVIAAVKAAGYTGSTTVVPGWASPSSDPYRLPRLRVLGGTSPEALLSELSLIRDDPAPPESYSA